MKWPIDIEPLKARLSNVNIDPLASSIARENPGREQFFQLVRDIKSFILISLLLSVLLYAPDQISELYRVIYANVCWNWHPSWFFRELPACLDEKSRRREHLARCRRYRQAVLVLSDGFCRLDSSSGSGPTRSRRKAFSV